MDVSKLPRLSTTSADPAAAPNEPALEPPEVAAPSLAPSRTDAPPSMSLGRTGDAFLSIGVGVILLSLYPRTLQWVFSRLFHTNFNEYFDTTTGATIPYPQTTDFWPDLGPTLFGVVLLLEGIALLATRSRAVLWMALTLTVLATAYNAIYVLVSFSTYGLAPISALAVVFGGYIAMSQWQQLKTTAPQRAR